MKVLLVSHATGADAVDTEYVELRSVLINDVSIRERLPRFLITCRSLAEFWAFIKAKSATYRERREFLWNAFNDLIIELETAPAFPSDESSASALCRPDRAFVNECWQKALARREEDPSGAITASRSLLECVCKSILHEANVEFDDNADLPKLYKLVAKQLRLAPDQHTEKLFKQVLGGCQSVVDGLGAIRNRCSDAHGSAPVRVRAEPRHAQLVVNLAGAAATFLIETWEARGFASSQEKVNSAVNPVLN